MMAKKTIKKQSGSDGPRLKIPETKEVAQDAQPPIFSLHHLRKDYCLSKCIKDEKAAFADTLHKLSQMKWSDLNQAPKHGIGFEKIKRSAFNNEQCIPSHITEDVKIIAFRFSGLKAMVGYRDPVDRKLFHIVWLDRDFTLYPHG